jgi:hypothetical protein
MFNREEIILYLVIRDMSEEYIEKSSRKSLKDLIDLSEENINSIWFYFYQYQSNYDSAQIINKKIEEIYNHYSKKEDDELKSLIVLNLLSE